MRLGCRRGVGSRSDAAGEAGRGQTIPGLVDCLGEFGFYARSIKGAPERLHKGRDTTEFGF